MARIYGLIFKQLFKADIAYPCNMLRIQIENYQIDGPGMEEKLRLETMVALECLIKNSDTQTCWISDL